jgi:type I restriction enzyme S subunit
VTDANGNGARSELPEGWEWATIGDVCEPVVKVKPGDRPQKPFKYIDISAVDRKRKRIGEVQTLLGRDAPSRARQRVHEGDVLVSTVRPNLQGVAEVPKDLHGEVASTGFSVLRPDPAIETKWLFYWSISPSFFSSLLTKARGVSYPAVLDKDVRAELIPKPPVAEQRRIVELIERAFGGLERGAALLDEASRKLDSMAAVAIEQAIWREPHSGDGVPVKELAAERRTAFDAAVRRGERLGRYKAAACVAEPVAVPRGTTLASVDEVAALVTDGDHNPPKRQPTGVPHLTAKNVREFSFDYRDTTYVAPADFEQSAKRYRPATGDVVVTCVGTIGRVAMVSDSDVFSADRNLAAVRPLPSVDARYLMYVLASPTMQQKMASASGSTAQPHLYLGDLRALPVPLPDAVSQRAAVARIEQVLVAVGALKAEVLHAQRNAAQLRSSALLSAFNGNLTNDRA